MASNLTLGLQNPTVGIEIPITADRTNGSSATTATVDFTISDKAVNVFSATHTTVTLNWNGSALSGTGQFEGLLTIPYGSIEGADYKSSISIIGTIRDSGVFVSNSTPVFYKNYLNDVKIDSVIPGNESVTILCSHDGSVENSLNGLKETGNVYIRKAFTNSNNEHDIVVQTLTLLADTTMYNDTRKHYKITLTGLTNETVYEFGVTMINALGMTPANNGSNLTKPSQYPASLTYETFNSLDASGGRFKISLDNQANTVATFKTLHLIVSYASAQVTVPGTVQTIDLSNNYPNGVGAKRQFEFLMPADIKSALLAGSAFNKFTVSAYLRAAIQDGSGNVIKTLNGAPAFKDYYMDRPLAVSSFSLDAIDWSDGKQTLKASVLGGTDICYNSVTATFDMSNINLSAVNVTDICNNVTSAKIDIPYSQLQNAKLSVKPRVKMSRQELNNAAVTNMSPFLELSHVLAALKQGTQPTTVDFTPLPTETTKTASFKFTAPTGAIDDLSANTFYRVQLDELGATPKSTVQDKTLKSVAQMGPSGETFTLVSNTITSGIKCVLRAFTMLDLSKYPAPYAVLNKGQQYLTSVEKNQSAAFKGIPDATISLRPSSATVDVLDTIRLSGNLKSNDIDNIYVFGQDICGGVLFQQRAITSTDTDICGRIMTHEGATGDGFAGLFTYDITFNVGSKPFAHNPVFLTGILDSNDDVDKVVVRTTTSAIETDFVAKVAVKNAASATFTIAEDLSLNYAQKDALYMLYDASFGEWNGKIVTASGEVGTVINDNLQYPNIRDSSGATAQLGSKWLYDQAKAAHAAALKERTDIHDHNLGQVVAKFDNINWDSHDTFIILLWRDVSNNANGYVEYVRAFRDASDNTIWGKSSVYPEYNNTVNPGDYNTAHGFTTALNLANSRSATIQATVISTEIAEENAQAKYEDIIKKIENFDAILKDKQDKLAALKTEQLGFATSRDNRKADLGTAAANAKLAKDSAVSALATARLAFFDVSGNTLA